MFEKGKSGNPKGKKIGTKNIAPMFKECEDLFRKESPALLQKAIDLARKGNEKLLRFFADKALNLKAVDPLYTLEMPEDMNRNERGDLIIDEVLAGHLPANVGKAMIEALLSLERIEETEELRERLETLEEMLNIT